MWPWQISTSNFQPTAGNFPGIHSTEPHPHQALSSQYATSQPPVPMAPGYSSMGGGHGHSASYPSGSGMGIGYGVSGMAVPVNPNLSTHPAHSETSSSAADVRFHSQTVTDEIGRGMTHSLHAVVPSNPPAPLNQGAPVNQLGNQAQAQQPVLQSPLGGGVSMEGSAVYHQSPSPVVTSPISQQGFPPSGGQHAALHSSSPFSVDFILRQRPANSSDEVSANSSSSQVVPGYGMMSSSEEAETQKGHSSMSDGYGQG